MRLSFLFTVVALTSLVTSCANVNEINIVNDLSQRGVKRSNIQFLSIQGSEADYGPDTKVRIDDPGIIDTIWRHLEESKPWGVYSACGHRTISFYTQKNQTTPQAAVRLLCGAAYVEGFDTDERMEWSQQHNGRKGLFVCPDLNEYIMPFLKQEYERKQAGCHGQAPLGRALTRL